VDNTIIIGNSIFLVQQPISQLYSNFYLKHLRKLDYFLGYRNSMHYESILLTRSLEISFKRLRWMKFKSMPCPMTVQCKLTKSGTYYFSDLTLHV